MKTPKSQSDGYGEGLNAGLGIAVLTAIELLPSYYAQAMVQHLSAMMIESGLVEVDLVDSHEH